MGYRAKLWVGTTNIVEVTEVVRGGGTPDAGAQVLVTVKEKDGVPVEGSQWPVTALPVAGEDGSFEAVLTKNLALRPSFFYDIEVAVTNSDGQSELVKQEAQAREYNGS